MSRFILFCLFIFVSPISIANEGQQCPKWWHIRSIALDEEQFPWRSVKKLRELEQPCLETEEYRTLAHYIATIEGIIGNHSASLIWMDRFLPKEDHSPTPLVDFTIVDAVPYIVNRAKDHRIVVTNERHHASSDRLLPLFLLKPLYDQGFRYLAVETLEGQHQINELGYVRRYDGYYTNDVVYAELLRSARTIGYKIIEYEQEDDQIAPEDPENPINRSAERDEWQAKNIIARTLATDPGAKVLIHCGYGHIYESKWATYVPMVHVLKQTTGYDPLTIGQTHFEERGGPEREHPFRRQLGNEGLLGNTPKILLNSHDSVIGADKYIDIEVVGLRTEYENNRPIWMRMGGKRHPLSIHTPECINRSCIVEVFDPDEDERAVPFDRLEVVRRSNATVYVPLDTTLKIRVMDLLGNTLIERAITAD